MRRSAPEWVSMIRTFVDAPTAVAIAGEDAGDMAREVARTFGLALTTEEIGFALLGLDHPEANRVRDLPEGSVDVVVLRRPWNGRVEASKALTAAFGALTPGGRLFAGERELDRLTKTSVLAYPIRAFVDAEPEVMRADLENSIGRLGLSAGTVRAGFKDGRTLDLDEHRGSHADVSAFVANFVDEDVSGVVARLGGAYSGREVEDVDPWVYVTGVKP